jgi:hypothetical protein
LYSGRFCLSLPKHWLESLLPPPLLQTAHMPSTYLGPLDGMKCDQSGPPAPPDRQAGCLLGQRTPWPVFVGGCSGW